MHRKCVTQEKRVKTDACSVSRSSRCSFTANAIHVPGLYDCMSNRKIVLLLHPITANKSILHNWPFNCIHVLWFVFFNLQKMKGSVLCNAAWNIFSLWHFYELTMKTDHAKCKLVRHTAALENAILGSVLLQHLWHLQLYCMSTDLLPQLVIKSGAVKRPGVIPVLTVTLITHSGVLLLLHKHTAAQSHCCCRCWICAYTHKYTHINKHGLLLPVRAVWWLFIYFTFSSI